MFLTISFTHDYVFDINFMRFLPNYDVLQPMFMFLARQLLLCLAWTERSGQGGERTLEMSGVRSEKPQIGSSLPNVGEHPCTEQSTVH